MKHVKTLNTQTMNNSLKKGGCGECQRSEEHTSELQSQR